MKRYPVRDQAAKWCVCGEWFASERDEREHIGKCPGPMMKPQFVGIDLASGPDRTIYVCREHINTPHPACPTCAEIARRSAQPQEAKP